MDKYLVPIEPPPPNPNQPIIPRPRWKRAAIEINGRIEPNYRQQLSNLLIQSYSQIGAFPHLYHIDGKPCRTHENRMYNVLVSTGCSSLVLAHQRGISALDFDNQGIYLASVTKAGCLTVHDFEYLYCQSEKVSGLELNYLMSRYDESKHVLHISSSASLDGVRWNPLNQDEVACISRTSSELCIYDVAYVSSKPIEVLRKRAAVPIHGLGVARGFSDVAFASADKSRIFACDNCGSVNIWDRRTGSFPSIELTTNSTNNLNSIQLCDGDQLVFGSGNQGMVYTWDLRGGRTSAAFLSHKEAYYPPMKSVKLSLLLEKIKSLKEQSDIIPMDVDSIQLDPSCARRLAFHYANGWSGILDIYGLEITHIHCPPPAWLTGSDVSGPQYLRKPCWLSTNSMYAVGSSSNSGLHLLDFYPDVNSPCHVDFREDMKNTSRRNRFISLSEDVTACVAHPLNASIVAGTKEGTLVVLSQQSKSWKADDGPE